MRKYGMPYKGSKNAIAEKLINEMPAADCFIDLFGGGGAMTDCALQSGKYNKVIYNELDTLVFKGFKMAVNGEFKGEKRWISREDFQRLKDTDPYAAMCFSFGNDLKTYCYAKEIENLKEQLHYIFFAETPNKARLHWRAFVREFNKSNQSLQSLESLERLQSLQRLERLQSLKRLELYNLSYEQVDIPANSVVYCDIPYKGTNKYKISFDYDNFYNWVRNTNEIVFISEYSMPDDFYCVASFEKSCKFSATSSKKTVEKLFCNEFARKKLGGLFL